ncbi:MAG: tripartite tricarboxylate transporter substrate binding protein [Xanthobacteraceae bacterium]|nr:tripartite tricarboxylate transporter substrate binding protein [Xanthobacteraceae bacterium]
MNLPRRTFLRLVTMAVALPAARVAMAQSYPTRPVRIVAGFPPGGINDIYARLIGQWLSDRLGQQFIVENRTGAGGTLAADAVVRAPGDGYTLLLATSGDTWNSSLYENLKYDFVRDSTAVAAIARAPGVLVVHPSVPAQSVPELLAYARADPGKLTVATAGIGSAPHMFWELFHSLTGADMLHVPYRGGGPALTDLLGGQVQVYFGTMASTLIHVRSGKLRALGVTSAARAPLLPDVPAIAETVAGYEASIFVGLTAPRATSPEIVRTINEAVVLGLGEPRLKQRITELGDTPLPLSPHAFGMLLLEETEKWRKVVKTAGIRAE